MLLIIFNQGGPVVPRGKGKAVGGKINWRRFVFDAEARRRRARESEQRLRSLVEGLKATALKEYRNDVVESIVAAQRLAGNNLVLLMEE